MKIKHLYRLIKQVEVKTVEKGEVIIKNRSRQKNVYFIKRGLVRSYLVNDEGEEITFQLYCDHQSFTNPQQLLFNEASKLTFDALEHTKIYVVDFDVLTKEIATDPDLSEIYQNLLFRRIIKRAFLRVESFVFLSPEERYVQFMKEYPKIVNRAPDKYIAHVLGITPVSLSRIRNRLSKK